MSAGGKKTIAGRVRGLHDRVYAAVCGRHPDVLPWHAQWVGARELYADLARVLPGFEGRVLDCGCGGKPYARWLGPRVTEHVGIDLAEGPGVDHVIEPGGAWPFEDASFDAVLCTQVLEHVADLEHFLGELRRVLRPGGRLVLTVPFVYDEHGRPHDYRRLSLPGVRALFEPDYEIDDLHAQGAIGSSLGLLFLNWCEAQANRWRPLTALKMLLLPVWVLFCLVVNLAGWILDRLDGTGAFYANVFLSGRRRQEAPRMTKP